MNILRFSLFALATGAAGCSFAARSPDMYRDDTAALLDTRSPQIKSCYDDKLKADKTLKGRVTVKFNVDHDTGALSKVAADPAHTTAPDPLVQCVLQGLQGLTLNPPDKRDGDATFVYEFNAG